MKNISFKQILSIIALIILFIYFYFTNPLAMFPVAVMILWIFMLVALWQKASRKGKNPGWYVLGAFFLFLPGAILLYLLLNRFPDSPLADYDDQ